jgi:hypothetical protein
MEYTILTNNYLKVQFDSQVEFFEGILFKILNNFLINTKVFYKITNINNLITIDFELYISELYICNLCANILDRDVSVCRRCKVIEINVNDLLEMDMKGKELYYNNNNINYISKQLLDLTNKCIYYINLIKRCRECNIYICTSNIYCSNCYWQKEYNIMYGKCLNDICCICHEKIYITDALSICGNNKHSIHKKCNRHLDKCPCCRGVTILVNGSNENTVEVYNNIIHDEDIENISLDVVVDINGNNILENEVDDLLDNF